MMQEATATTNEEILPVPLKTKLLDLIILVGCLSLLVILFGYLRPLARPDALASFEIAREMLVSNHWVTPTLNNVIQLDYPPLFYWLTALSFKIFGYTLFAARFWSAVFGILGTITLYLFGCWFAGRRMGWLCALVASSSLLYLTLFTAGAPYIIGSVLLTIGLCSIFVAALSESKTQQMWLIVLFWTSSAANCLLLGLAGLIIPLLIIIIYSLMMGYKFELKALVSPKGIFIFLILTLPCFFLVQKQNPHFLSFFFFESIYINFIKHFHAPLEKLLWVLLGAFVALSPWGILINLGYWVCKPASWAARSTRPLGIFILVWLIITAIYLIGIAPIRAGSFLWVSLLTPALSLAIAKGLNNWWDGTDEVLFKASRGLLVLVMVLLTAFFCLISKYTLNIKIGFATTPTTEHLLWFIYIVFLIGGIATYFALKSKNGIKLTALVLMITGFVTTVVFISALPRMRQDSMQPITTYIAAHQQAGDVIAEYKHYYPDVSFALQKAPIVVIGWSGMPTYGALYQNTQGWVVGSLFFWETMQHNKRNLFFIAPKSTLPELQDIILKNHLKQVVETGRAVLFTY